MSIPVVIMKLLCMDVAFYFPWCTSEVTYVDRLSVESQMGNLRNGWEDLVSTASFFHQKISQSRGPHIIFLFYEPFWQWFSSGWMLELQEVLQWEYGSAAIGKVSTLEESSMKCIYLHIWLILHMYLRFVVRIRCVYFL